MNNPDRRKIKVTAFLTFSIVGMLSFLFGLRLGTQARFGQVYRRDGFVLNVGTILQNGGMEALKKIYETNSNYIDTVKNDISEYGFWPETCAEVKYLREKCKRTTSITETKK